MSDPTNINFWSGKNYMKRDTSSGQSAMAAPRVLSFSSPYTTTLTVAHNLGYTPFFDVFYEPFKDGIIWDCGIGSRNQGSAINPTNPGGASGPYMVAYADATNIYLELGYGSNLLTGTYNAYWVIYLDYRLA